MYKLIASGLMSLVAILGVTFQAVHTPRDCPDCCKVGKADLQKQVVDPYVQVNTSAGTGSGTVVVVGGKELILTASHVVREAHEAKKGGLKFPVFLLKKTGTRSSQIEAEVVAFSDVEEKGGHDLALLDPGEKTGWASARLLLESACGLDLVLGEEVYYCGTPAGLHASLEKSIISRTDYFLPSAGKDRDIVVNGNVWYGSSGCGVYVQRAEGFLLAGVVVRAAANPGDYPKCPGACKGPGVIKGFIDSYLKGCK